jgi:hypothetical protein
MTTLFVASNPRTEANLSISREVTVLQQEFFKARVPGYFLPDLTVEKLPETL